jgi:hypothetical protein
MREDAREDVVVAVGAILDMRNDARECNTVTGEEAVEESHGGDKGTMTEGGLTIDN